MEFDSVFTVKKEITKETFLREALIEIAKSSETPIDVVNSKFGEVRESVKEIMLCSAHVESDYTASIGYDREETYWTKEKKYNSSTKQHYYVDVEKKRTVTDWQPHSGHISGDSVYAEINAGEDTKINFVKVLQGVKDENIIEKGEAEVDADSLESAKQGCRYRVEAGIRYPGDHHKDERSSATITVGELTCYKMPFYEVEYTYKGKKYKVEAFACGELIVSAQTPPNDINIEAVAENDTEKYKKGKIAGWIAFAGTYVFSWIMFAVGVYWTWFIPTIALVAATVLHVVYNKKYSERVRSLKEDNLKLKQAELKNALSKAGYSPLTANENEAFNAEKGGKSYSESHKKKRPTGWTILGAVLSVILIITSLIGGNVANNKRLHSPEQVTISLISKTQEFKDDDSRYTYGCYYIYTKFKIETDKIGVDYMKFKTTVTDKNGKELGYITTSLDTMNLDAGGEKVYETYLWETQLKNGSLFTNLYNANYSELTFSYEILSIEFSDGQYYHGSSY